MNNTYQAALRVLIVDDHQVFLEGLKNTLAKYDWVEVVGTTHHAEEAIAMTQSLTPDLLISDISMPDMSGLEMVEKIRAQNNKIKIIFLSMFEQPLINHHVQGYLKKDTTEKELLEALDKVGRKHERYFQGDSASRRDEFIKDHFLTKREKQIISCLADDLSAQEIADALGISYSTVVVHKKNIFFKLNVKSSAAAVSSAIRLGVLQV